MPVHRKWTMAALQCPGCKAYLRITNPQACPRCQTPLLPPRPSTAMVGAHKGRTTSPVGTLLAMAALGAIVILVGLIVFRSISPSSAQIHSRQVSQALANCQHRIRSTAQFGDAELPPHVQNYGTKGEFYFAWPSGSFHFKNGFGAPLKMSASCIGDLSTGEIKQMTVNGKDVL